MKKERRKKFTTFLYDFPGLLMKKERRKKFTTFLYDFYFLSMRV